MKEIFWFPLIKILTFSALVWISPNSYRSAILGELWENRIGLNDKLDVRNSRLLSGSCTDSTHENSVNLKERKHNMLKDEDHYDGRSPSRMRNKPNAREQTQDPRFRGKPDKLTSKTKNDNHFGRRKDKITNEKIHRRSKDTSDVDEDDNFLKEPDDGYYRREENVEYGVGNTEYKKPTDSNVQGIQKKPEVNNKDLEKLPLPPNENVPNMLEYYDYSKVKKCVMEKLINALKKMDVQFQLKFMRYMKARNYSAEREFLELRSGKEVISYYFRRNKIMLPLVIQTLIFSVFLVLTATITNAFIAMFVMSCISGELFLNLCYYYLKAYMRVRRIRRTFKKHGVKINE
ncbi:Uncharacterized protein PCOAH_00013190 [Plasmodium coatneyi]|uniref:Pv-fam-d protein n=1 Tax=Plasmodium coatneyi TaxID=208452 RepID=A0A1B1DWB0_9APIC|nr:Uncharacterized protein PCOAH_00013190 [Plasmodium coatneyi]ANQ07076.1 Uncharacterized protein PCOAH_00013190 [Plasmodium coatneyi]